jgi:hypothetical protein
VLLTLTYPSIVTSKAFLRPLTSSPLPTANKIPDLSSLYLPKIATYGCVFVSSYPETIALSPVLLQFLPNVNNPSSFISNKYLSGLTIPG